MSLFFYFLICETYCTLSDTSFPPRKILNKNTVFSFISIYTKAKRPLLLSYGRGLLALVDLFRNASKFSVFC